MYYLNYHYQGTGIVPVKLAMGLSRGILAHDILRDILSYCVVVDKLPPATHITESIDKNTQPYLEEVRKRGLEDLSPDLLIMESERQACLVEGMVRAWCKVRLPFILEHYKVVQVEKEFEVHLDDPEMVLMCRLDGVVQRRSDNEYSALEFKTTSTTDSTYYESWRYATQSLLHLEAIRKQFGVTGNSVLFEFLQTGLKRKDEMSGMDVYYSPLVRGFEKFGNPPLEPEREYGWESGLSRKRGWQVFNVWDHTFPEKPDWMNNSEYWVEHVLDRETLQGQLQTREVFRNPDELEEMVRNTIAQQKRIYYGLQMLEGAPAGSRDNIMAGYFPGNLDESCYSNKWRRSCPFLPVCYHQIEDPMASGAYQPREPHHEAEFEV